ncbi:MAG: hypothetical protein ABFD92_02420 [Planctomycetaceae bacterium]|nr:hypothetical protein [Planctomycetaceae bacterium]
MSEDTLPWWNAQRHKGFRFSLQDAVAVAAAVPLTWVLWSALGPVGLFLPVVLGHFFLFCNVFRVGRRFEIIWAMLFMVNACALLWFESLVWWRAIVLQMPATLTILAVTIARRNYRGIGWTRIHRAARAGSLS